MGTAFEVAVICDLQPDRSPHIVDVLTYMTRSQDYEFDMSIDHRFFHSEGYENEWRNIIANNHSRCGEEHFPQVRRSSFRNGKLCFRILLDDDTLCNVGYDFLDWLELISDAKALVGYYTDLLEFESLLLIDFNNGEVREIRSPRTQATSLIEAIDTELGGSGFMHPFLS